MSCSEARKIANRENAAKSTGPKTPEGKAASRANAFKHGFCAEVIVGKSETQTFGERIVQIALTPPPASPDSFDHWAAGQAALLATRIEHCQEIERAIRARIVLRADLTWEEDKNLEATLLAAGLAKRPEEVSTKLVETYEGCRWMVVRWGLLAQAAEIQGGSWTPEQERLAFDLMGIPPEFRPGHRPWTVLGTYNEQSERLEGPADLARSELLWLGERSDCLAPIDQADRERARADLGADSDPELKRLRRYETTLQRRLQWSLDLFHQLRAATQQPPAAPASESKPESTPEVKAEDEAEVKSIAESSAATAPPRPESPRALIKRRKEEARRQERRRKLDSRRN